MSVIEKAVGYDLRLNTLVVEYWFFNFNRWVDAHAFGS